VVLRLWDSGAGIHGADWDIDKGEIVLDEDCEC
jgi:hypothetical protein